jgi:PKD repeat protein
VKRLLLALLPGTASLAALAQCGPCAVGDTCTVSPPFPTVCPAITPVGVVGVPYDLNVTFWIPPSFPEPTTGLNVVLQQVAVQYLERLPLGLTYEASSPSLIYQPQQDPFGCVRICGIPMVAGNDTLLLVARAQGTVGGIGTAQDYTLPIPFQVLPAAADTVADFVFSPDSLCAPMTVSFSQAQPAPGMTSAFAWDFGNGSAFSGEAPPAQNYADGGTYPVSLNSTFSVPRITQLSITGVSNAWCGDLDEPNLPIIGCVGQPDLYFTLTDARLVLHRSTLVSNAQSTTWSTLSIPLGYPPFTLRVWDKDELSADDLLGTFTITSATGAQSFSQSGTAGSRTVQVQTVLSTSFTDTVTVFAVPQVSLAVDLLTGAVCAEPGDLALYQWFFDGEPVPDESGPCVGAANGEWTVTATSSAGCSGSAALTVSGVGMAELNGRPLVLRVAPNPATDALRITHGCASEGAELTLLDAQGRVVRALSSRRDQPGGATVSLAGLVPGPYVVRLTCDGLSRSERVFIIR